MQTKYILTTLLLVLSSVTHILSASYIWTGTSSTNWNTTSNWSPAGIPVAADYITLNSNAPNNLVLDQNRTVANFTINGDTLDLGTYILTTTGVTYFNGGLVTNGNLNIAGSLCHFGGATINARIEASCGYYHMNGGLFLKPVDLVSSGTSNTTGTGSNIFEDSLMITHSDVFYFTMGSSTNETFNGPVTITNHATKEVYMANGDTSFYNANVTISSTGNGGVAFGNGGGVSVLASGKTISIGSGGFGADYLTLKKLKQIGTAAQTLTLTGTAIVNLVGCEFNGNLTLSAGGFLLKDDVFKSASTFTKTGTANCHSDGNNTYNGATSFANNGSSGRLRLSATEADVYSDHVSFNSTGQDVQVCYTGNNYFYKNVTINSNKVVFNTSTGKVTLAGDTAQSLNGSYNYAFKKLAINKSANQVTANTTLSVDDTLFFVSGNLITTATNLLTMKAGSKVSGASSNSFVSGPVKKIGNTAFQFPVGKNNQFRSVEITSPTNATDAFTAEYFDTTQALGSAMDTTITFISDCGYWNLSRSAGTSNITPKFAFDSTHCDYLTVKPVHITFWDGTKWTDKGEGVNDSNTKKTNAAVTSYGNFALAYNLIPGDAPQFPYELTLGTTCTAAELMFDTKDKWFAFSPDSAVVKIGLFNSDPLKLYAAIQSATIYEAYIVGDTLNFVNDWHWNCDSALYAAQLFATELTPSTSYLMKVSKYDTSGCAGIYDTTKYYLNVCLLNLRTNPNTEVCLYDDALSLLGCLGNGTATYMGSAVGGDIVAPLGPGLVIDLNDLNPGAPSTNFLPPLYVGEGVRFTGDYDLLSLTASFSHIPPLAGNGFYNQSTTPNGTLITYNQRGNVPAQTLLDQGYMFILRAGSSIHNLRIQGAMPGYQDFNQDRLLCAGIKLENSMGGQTGPYLVSHCELFNFSYAGLFARANTADVTIDHCIIHHVKGTDGETTAKGYGTWFEGVNIATEVGNQFTVKNCIFDECKAAMDMQPNAINFTLDSCTFGEYFIGETLNKHAFNISYEHVLTNSPCPFYAEHGANCSPVDVAASYPIPRHGAGNINITNSIFYQQGKVISLPYPANANVSTPGPLYRIALTQNTFAQKQDLPESFDAECNLGGYARIADNYVEACVWEWERFRGTDNYPSTSNNPPILTNAPNSFSYVPDVAVVNDCPQPPQVTIDYASVQGYVAGYAAPIAYVNMGDNVEVVTSFGSIGSQKVAYVIRPHPNNGDATSALNSSANNAYYDSQVVTPASTTSVTTVFGPTATNVFDTDKPGLYGMDVMAVDGSTNSSYYASPWVHKPIIVVPASNNNLIFNIKDSYFAVLYGNPTDLMNVYKQVELNGHVIWREDISEGGDGWERVEIDLKAGTYNGVDIVDFLDIKKLQQTITFSISMPDPDKVLTDGGVPMTGYSVLRGLQVWVDDVYLKKSSSAENLIKDGDIENSLVYGLNSQPLGDGNWYSKNLATFNPCITLDDSGTLPNIIAKTEVGLTTSDRKSGNKAIRLKLPGIYFSTCNDHHSLLSLATPAPDEGEIVSAAVDFDYRDYLNCNELTDVNFLSAENRFVAFPSGPYSSASPQEFKNYFIDQDITINSGTPNDYLLLNGCQLLVLDHTPPWKITIENNATLEINDYYDSNSEVEAPSRIFSCEEMWSGIKNNGGTIVIRPSFQRPTEIYDALTGIESDGGTVDIRYALFDRNYIGLHLKNGTFISGGANSSHGIIGIDFKCSGGKILKAPWTGEPSNTHILLENVSQIQIGSSGSNGTGYTNTYSDAVYGIRTVNSSVIIINNDFNKMQNFSDVNPCFTCGTAIYAMNDAGNLALTIGGAFNPVDASTAFLKNTFNNSKIGVFTKGNFNLTIQGNKFEEMVQGVRTNRNSGDIEINEGNTFENVNFGITAYNVKGNVEISNNVFTTLSTPSLPHTISFNNTAITIQNPLSRFVSQVVSVFGNEIMDYRIGIHAINIPAIGIGIDLATNTISGNTISYTINNFPLANYHGGIWLQNCALSRVVENSISNTEFNTDDNFRGIDIESSLNCDVNCNEIDKLGIAINFDGHCDETQLRQNLLNDFDIGVNINISKIALTQGTPSTSGIATAWDNVWTMTPGNSYDYKVAGDLIGGSQILWYHQGLDDPNQDFSPNPWEVLNMINPEDYQSTTGDPCTTSTLISNDRRVHYGPIVGDSATYTENSDENLYLANVIAYYAMKTDSIIIYQGDSLDSDFESYFMLHDTTNIGKLYLVESLIDREPDSALAIVNNMDPDNAIEIYLLEHYQRSQDILESGGDLSASDSAFYMERTTGTSITQGVVYFYGLGSLFIEKHPIITSSRIGDQTIIESSQIELENATDLNVYPNPSTGSVILKLSNPEMVISNVEIYNSMGEKLLSKRIEQNSFQIDMFSFENGIYFVRCIDNENGFYMKSFNLLK